MTTAFTILIYLGGAYWIYDQERADGASRWQSFWRGIEWPISLGAFLAKLSHKDKFQ